jgi:hypothetical protein
LNRASGPYVAGPVDSDDHKKNLGARSDRCERTCADIP